MTADALERTRSQPGNKIPFATLQQCFTQLLVRCEEKPVVRCHQRSYGTGSAQSQAAKDKCCSKVGLALLVVRVEVGFEQIMLPIAAKVRHVRDDERIFVGQEVGGLDHAGGGDGALSGLVIGLLGFEDGGQIRLGRVLVGGGGGRGGVGRGG